MIIDTLYTDPRLVALYDTLNPFAADTAFYLDLASAPHARHVVDIGCGTGLLACELASRGHAVTGIDPARAMLDVARTRPHGEHVQWIEGDAALASESIAQADLVVMTGHVAQVFIDDASWARTLRAAHRMLRTGGRLAFESRHPQHAPWRNWTPARSRRTIVDGDGHTVDVSQTLLDVRDDCVRFATHYAFASTGDALVATSELRFRSQAALAASLDEAGFDVTQWYGDWSRGPVDDASRELIVVAARR